MVDVPTSNSSKKLTPIYIVVIALIIIAIIWYFTSAGEKDSPVEVQNTSTIETNLTEISGTAGVSPAEKIQSVDTAPNPIEDIYKNPFD